MKTTNSKTFDTVYDVFLAAIDTIRAPERISVSQAAMKYRYVYQPGAYIGPWKNSETPYMIEPMDMFTSRTKVAMALMMSAQTGKTDSMILNTTLYTTIVDPMDMIIYNPTHSLARDFSIRRIDRLMLHSKKVGEQLLRGRDSDNVFDKHFKNGTILSLSHPAPGELAGRPIGRVLMTDYDRFPMDVGGEGSPFDLGSKRTTTFGSMAMCMAESSPSMPIIDPKWIARSAHEAPPCDGIANLYNRGDRRLWHWPCPHCEEYFEGRFELLTWDKTKPTNLEKARTVQMICPECGSLIDYKERREMQQWGIWVPEGMRIEKGKLVGDVPDNLIASYWLKGVAAAFVTWEKLVFYYLNAEDEYQRTMSEEALKKFWNTDMGMPYLPKSMRSVRSPDSIKAMAISLPVKTVPSDVRFLVGTVDVQKTKFVVEVWGIRPGQPFDQVLIDRYDIVKNPMRLDENDEPEPLDPAGYLEDWHTLTRQVIRAKYPLEGGAGVMGVKLTLCDSGGRAGVTANAYNYYRQLNSPDYGLGGRFLLIKGRSTPNTPRVALTYPDSTRKDRYANARGEIPVLLINTNLIKDMFDGRLGVLTPGKGMVVHPDWLSDEYYRELCVEIRTPKGWENPNSERNEAWDLGCYCIAGCVSPYIGIEHIQWDRPPLWAEEWDKNIMVELTTEKGEIVRAPASRYDFAKFGSEMA